MTTITVDVRIGGGQPPSEDGRGKSYVLYAPYDVVNTSAGRTIVPVPKRTEIGSDGTATVTVDALPAETPYVFQFEIDNGFWKSQPILAIVPASGTHKLADLVDLSGGFTAPAWYSDVLGAKQDVETVAAGIAAQAEDAVDAAMAGREVVASKESNENIVSFTDPAGHRSWMEIDTTTGGPTAHSTSLLSPRIAPLIKAQGDAEGWTLVELDPEKYGYVFAIADSAGRWALAIDTDGTVHIPDLNSDTSLSPGSVTEEYLSTAVQKRLGPKVVGTQFQANGDSQTAAGSGYGSYLSAELGGASVTVEAMGGHGVDEIAARQGGRPSRATAQGNLIPATVTAVNVTLDVDLFWQTDGTGTLSRSVVIGGGLGDADP